MSGFDERIDQVTAYESSATYNGYAHWPLSDVFVLTFKLFSLAHRYGVDQRINLCQWNSSFF